MVLGTTHDGGARQASRLAALFAALTAGLAMGCPLERGLSCGDGWVDPDFEECDPKDPFEAHVGACEERGFEREVTLCDPYTCTIRKSDEDCNTCGDGRRLGDEECDGLDLGDAVCSNGDTEAVRCRDDCTLDFSACPGVCGDGVLGDFEECDPGLACSDDDDCPEDMVCYRPYGQCIKRSGDSFAPGLSCSLYPTKVIGGPDKSYNSGVIERCTDECFFGRNNCGFCGDGELDDEYTDLVWPDGVPVGFDAEVCDNDEADRDRLHDHCRPLCAEDDALDGGVSLECSFECNAGCTDFVDVIAPPDAEPGDFDCCLAAGSPCIEDPNDAGNTPGVPDLPCCSWLENQEWMDSRECVWSAPPNASRVCPSL